jgi:hypothetical protein
MSCAGKKKSSIHSHSFCLKKKKCFLPPKPSLSTNFSLFLKNGKNAKKHIQEDARPFQKTKAKIN